VSWNTSINGYTVPLRFNTVLMATVDEILAQLLAPLILNLHWSLTCASSWDGQKLLASFLPTTIQSSLHDPSA